MSPAGGEGGTAGCAVILGVGARNGIGGATALLAARNGLHVFLGGRTREKLEAVADEIRATGGAATAVPCDVESETDIGQFFEVVDGHGAPLSFMLYNVGRNIPAPFLQSDTELISGHWRRCVLGGTLAGQHAVRRMLGQDPQSGSRGTILYTGASASLRGKPLFAGFASAKAGLRAMAQSMAREFGPQGIHVAHAVIDGVVDGEIVRSIGGVLGRAALRRKGEDGALQPEEIARSFWALHQQHRSAWTQEIDLRPWKESF